MGRFSEVSIPEPDVWIFSNQFKVLDEGCLKLVEVPMPQHTSNMCERVDNVYRKDPMRVLRELPELGVISYSLAEDLLKYKHIDWLLHYFSITHNESRCEVFVLFPSRNDRLQFELTHKETLPCQIHRINPASYEI